MLVRIRGAWNSKSYKYCRVYESPWAATADSDDAGTPSALAPVSVLALREFV